MKNVYIATTFLGMFFSLFINQYAFSNHSNYSLKTGTATLSIDSKGKYKIVGKKEHEFNIEGSISNLWKVSVQDKLTGKKYDIQQCNDYKIFEENGRIHIKYDGVNLSNKKIPLKAEFTISVKDYAFCFSGFVKNTSDKWIIRSLEYPCLPEISFKREPINIYWPDGLGKLYPEPEEFGNKSFYYPSVMGAMPWFSVNSPDAGLYIGCHDSLQNSKTFNLFYDKSKNTFNTSISIPVFDIEHKIPDIMVKPYSGEWYTASKFYRNWYNNYFTVSNPPDWTINDTGWLLAILKQQNLEVMWPYEDIDKLCDVAEGLNLTTIGLFGWAVGGHDRYYPNYQPDNLMGGREELMNAIKRANKRGIKIILYANGTIMDTSTDFYQYNGIETMYIKENRQPGLQFFVKQKNCTPVIFAQACAGSKIWRKTMSDLALQAISLGADGILFDMVGVVAPFSCFSKNHDHEPGHSDGKYRLQMIREISQKTKEINPDFIVMTEATNDLIIREIDYHHGWGSTSRISKDGFPELFRYTFPELLITQRNTNPMITRSDANFAAVYGFRHEIESRYPGDVEYLLNGTLPIKESYSNVVDPPDIKKMNLEPMDKTVQYVHSLIEFETANADFFRRGIFIDEEGIEVTGPDILAKGFINGNRLGIVVWNQHLSESRSFSVAVPGYELKNAAEPGNEKIDAFVPVSPNSVRLLIYSKK